MRFVEFLARVSRPGATPGVADAMPDDDESGKTAALTRLPSVRTAKDALENAPGKGPARLAIPLSELPKLAHDPPGEPPPDPVGPATMPERPVAMQAHPPPEATAILKPPPRAAPKADKPRPPRSPAPMSVTMPEQRIVPQAEAGAQPADEVAALDPRLVAKAARAAKVEASGAPKRSKRVSLDLDLSVDNQPPVQLEEPRVDDTRPEDTRPEFKSPVAAEKTEGKRETTTPEAPGRYEMKREFGRGGQSSVWLALDRHIGRDVAFKQLLPQHSDPRAGASKQVVSAMAVRFLREARITGQLEHPSIVPVYEVGKRPDGTFYYTQKLVRGRTLTDAIKACKTVRERLALLPHFIDLCQAIAYAHKRGVIHRDIKPDNVMVGEFGETVVLDWGLAKQLSGKELVEDDEEELARTQEGDIMGTPAYMSPEQAQGKKREIDAQSDVWSLGAVLYEILTGRPPFVGRNLMTMLVAVTKDPIPPPKELERGVPAELAAIAMHALTRDKPARYQTPREMIRDVEAWRTGGKVQVYRYTPWGTAARWLRKNRAIAVTALCVMLALGVGSIRVWRENLISRHNLAEALLEKSGAASRDLSWERAAVYAAAARVEDDTAEARWRAAHRGPVEIEPILRVNLPGPVDRLALSPDGQLLAFALTGGGLHLVDASGKELHALEIPGDAVAGLVFSPDGALLAASVGSQILVFNTSSGEQAGKLEGPGRVEQLAFSPDGGKLAAAQGTSARIYETQGWKLLAQLDGHQGAVRGVAFAPDQSGLATTGDDGTLRFWSPLPEHAGQHMEMKLVRAFGHSPVPRLAFAPAGHILIPASSDGTVRFFDVDSGVQQTRLATNQGALLDLATAGQGLVASLGQDSSVILIDTLAQVEVARLEGDDSSTAVALSADGSRLASANRDGKLRLWRVTPGARVSNFEAPPGFAPAVSLAFSPSGKQVAAGDAVGHIQIWESATGKRLSSMDLPLGPVGTLAWSPDGNHLAAAGPDEMVSLFEIASGQRTTLEGQQGLVRALAYSPDGKTLASVGHDGQIHLWDPEGQTQKATLPASNAPLYAVAYSRDGKLLGAAGEDKVVHLFDANSHKARRKIDGSPDVVLALAFSPHNTLVATAGRDQAIRSFRVDGGKLRSVWNGHGARIYSIAFAPDGQILASASADGSIRLWDVRTGREVVRFERSPEPRALAFSADGKMLASAGERPAVQIVELDDKSALLSPGAELKRQLAKHKLRFDGILLVDDPAALAGKPWKISPPEAERAPDESPEAP